jgi:nucleoside-diphosphate-sugar epimerase
MKRVYVAGHRGLVGSALVRRLTGEPIELITRSRQELDLENPIAVLRFLPANARPTCIWPPQRLVAFSRMRRIRRTSSATICW